MSDPIVIIYIIAAFATIMTIFAAVALYHLVKTLKSVNQAAIRVDSVLAIAETELPDLSQRARAALDEVQNLSAETRELVYTAQAPLQQIAQIGTSAAIGGGILPLIMGVIKGFGLVKDFFAKRLATRQNSERGELR